MVAGHGGRTLPAGGDRRTRLVFMVRTWRRAASARHALTPPTYPRCPAWAPYNFPNRISRPKAGGCPCSTSLSPRRSSPSQGSTSACAGAGTMPRKQTHTRTDKPGTPAAGRIPGLRNTPGRRSACTGPYRLPYDTGRQTHRREWTAISRRPTADGGQWAEGCEQGCGLWAVGTERRAVNSGSGETDGCTGARPPTETKGRTMVSSLSDNKTRRRYFFVSAFFGSALTLIEAKPLTIFSSLFFVES